MIASKCPKFNCIGIAFSHSFDYLNKIMFVVYFYSSMHKYTKYAKINNCRAPFSLSTRLTPIEWCRDRIHFVVVAKGTNTRIRKHWTHRFSGPFSSSIYITQIIHCAVIGIIYVLHLNECLLPHIANTNEEKNWKIIFFAH